MGYTITQAKCPQCGEFLFDSGRFLQCDECGHIEEKTNEKIIASIKKEYPNAVITETADKIVVDFQITLLQPVKQIKISGVVEL